MKLKYFNVIKANDEITRLTDLLKKHGIDPATGEQANKNTVTQSSVKTAGKPGIKVTKLQ